MRNQGGVGEVRRDGEAGLSCCACLAGGRLQERRARAPEVFYHGMWGTLYVLDTEGARPNPGHAGVLGGSEK